MGFALLVLGSDVNQSNALEEEERKVVDTDAFTLTTLSSLPVDMKQRIVFFLSTHDLMALARASNSVAHDLVVCINLLGDPA